METKNILSAQNLRTKQSPNATMQVVTGIKYDENENPIGLSGTHAVSWTVIRKVGKNLQGFKSFTSREEANEFANTTWARIK